MRRAGCEVSAPAPDDPICGVCNKAPCVCPIVPPGDPCEVCEYQAGYDWEGAGTEAEIPTAGQLARIAMPVNEGKLEEAILGARFTAMSG